MGPKARKDAETAERDRWIQLLANLLRSTDTPMGKLIRENPSNIQLLEGVAVRELSGREYRAVQKCLGMADRFPRHQFSSTLEAT